MAKKAEKVKDEEKKAAKKAEKAAEKAEKAAQKAEESAAAAPAEKTEAAEAPKAEQSSVTAPVNPLERTVEVTVSQQALSAETEKRLKDYAKRARIDGFRRGHVPMNIVRGMYGQEAYGDALNQLVGQAVDKAVADGSYRLAGAPVVEPSKDMPTDGKSDLKFTARFEVLPEIEAPDFSAVSLKRYTCEVTDKEVTSTLDVMRKQRATYKEVDRASKKDDEITVDFEGKIDGKVFEGGSAKDFSFLLGSGQMLPEFDQAATGMSKGETKTFKLTFPEGYAKELAGKEAEFTVTVKKVAEPVLPALDDKFASEFGIKEGVDKLKKEVEENLKREVKSRLNARTKEGVFSALLDLAKFDLPQVMVEDEAKRITNEYRQNLASRGLDVSKIPFDPKNFTSQAQRRVRLGLIVSKLIADNKIQSTPEQVKAFAAEMASAYEKPEEVTAWYLKDENRYAELSAAVIENNLVDFVLGKSKTADEAIDFNTLMGRAA